MKIDSDSTASVSLTYNIVHWYFEGFNETVVQMAQQYARFLVFAQWFEGLDEAYGNLLVSNGTRTLCFLQCHCE